MKTSDLSIGPPACEASADALIRPDERITRVNDDLSLIEKKGGLSLGTDALLLAAFCPSRPAGDAIELGAGSGIVSLLSVLRGKFRRVECVEIRPDYADLCRRNVEINRLGDRVSVTCADLRDHRAYAVAGGVDCVFANPPYMKRESGLPSRDEGRDAARRELWGGITDFCEAAARKLRPGGDFAVVFWPPRAVDLFCALRGAGLEPKKMTWVCAREGAAPSLLLLSAKKGSKPGMIVSPPLYLEQGGGASEDMQRILDRGVFPF
ncbi:MAG: methyltransferase [Clostridia bacterium]|nr:methyltransferase [Clostridia bacterium]